MITPTYKEVKPTGYYFYIHRKSTDKSEYYVGKGETNRAWSTSGRSDWWRRIKGKYGIVVDIVQSDMTEDTAFLLEMWLIAKLRHEGCDLCNMTDGGDGVSGLDHPSKKVIYCSNGMIFKGLTYAVEWLRDNVNVKAMAGGVSACARGVSNSSYGFGWSYDGFPDVPEFSGKESIANSTIKTHSKPVYCSNGIKFESSELAAQWLFTETGSKCSASSISAVCNGEYLTAHGFAWSRVDFPEEPKLTGRSAISASISEANRNRSKKVYCSNGMAFDSSSEAMDWIKITGYPNGSPANINACASGKVNSAFGYVWSYANWYGPLPSANNSVGPTK